jgi:drug/metabolite transporter (DMT)-like permease
VRRRSGWLVLVLGLASLGGYVVAWLVATARELNRLGARVPRPWLLAAGPVGGLYWAWCWAEGVGHVTAGRTSTVGAFLRIVLLGPIGVALLQARFNRLRWRPG